MKSLLLYLVEFSKDESKLPKEYPNNCTIGNLDQRLIIIIINDKSIFSANNSY